MVDLHVRILKKRKRFFSIILKILEKKSPLWADFRKFLALAVDFLTISGKMVKLRLRF